MTEKEWQAQVVGLATTLGWQRYHTYRSTKSPGGFPDEVLVRERILFVELKTETGKLSPLQLHWLEKLRKAGGEVYVWRPRDLEFAGKVLQRRNPGLEVVPRSW